MMTVFFAVAKSRDADGLAYIGYKLVVSYNSFAAIVVDTERSSRENAFVFIRLRYPPQVGD